MKHRVHCLPSCTRHNCT